MMSISGGEGHYTVNSAVAMTGVRNIFPKIVPFMR